MYKISFSCKIWQYGKRNYDKLRKKVSEFDWNDVYIEDIDQYPLNVFEQTS